MKNSVCKIEGCSKISAKNTLYCSTHFERKRKFGDPLHPVEVYQPRGSALERNDDGHKRCRTCDMWYPESAFGKQTVAQDGLNPRCKECLNTMRHGLTGPQYREMLREQGGVCKICKIPSDRTMHIDHDHNCCEGTLSCGKCVRGILCANCNTGLGYFRDSVMLLKGAIDYLS